MDKLQTVLCVVRTPTYALTLGRRYPVIDRDETKRSFRVRDDRGRMSWFPCQLFDTDGTTLFSQWRSVWIEREHWTNSPQDDVTLVRVDFESGQSWWANFLTIVALQALQADSRENGHYLKGLYYWIEQPVFVANLERSSIDATISDLIESGSFETAFRKIDDPIAPLHDLPTDH